MNITTKVTIIRNSNDVVRITLTDAASRLRFVEVDMTPHDFAMALTGLSFVDAPARVSNLEHVGHQVVAESRSVLCPLKGAPKDQLKAWLVENFNEPGWILDTYLGSQNSITRVEDGTILRFPVRKYLPPTTAGNPGQTP